MIDLRNTQDYQPPFDTQTRKGVYKGYQYIVFFNWVGGDREGKFMGFPTAYIKIPKDHPMFPVGMKWKWYSIGDTLDRLKKSKSDLANNMPKPSKRMHERHYHRDYDSLNDFVYVHGGFTFANYVTFKNSKRWTQGFDEGFWVGWDYGHAGDEMYPDLDRLMEVMPEIYLSHTKFQKRWPNHEHKWTMDEVEKEVKKAISGIKKIHGT